MDLLELQQRANILVDKVNTFEANLVGTEFDESQVINEHKYADIFCLRPVLKLLFGKDLDEKLSRTTVNDIDLSLVSSSAPAWNSNITFFNNEFTSNKHDFEISTDSWNRYNLLQLDALLYRDLDRQTAIEQGIRYSYSANIKDALVTESQVSSVFNWNTSNGKRIGNNVVTLNRQVPGIVLYYLGNDYTGKYTATIPYNVVNFDINRVNYKTPPLYGAYYDTDQEVSQVGLEPGGECCRVFIPGCIYMGGRLMSPQQIYQPNRIVGDDNNGLGYNWQGKAVYHELVFKQRRKGCSDAGLDFQLAVDDVADNDPQGLATRLILAQMKPYYYNRPWFTELNELYSPDGTLTSGLYQNIDKVATVDIYENQLADFIKLQGSPVYNLDTGEYTATDIDNYLYIDSSNELFNEGVVTIEIAVTMSQYSSNTIITNVGFMGIDTITSTTTIRAYKNSYNTQGQTGSIVNTLTRLRISVNKTTKEVVCYKQNYSTQAWEQFASFTPSGNFNNFRLATSERFALRSKGVINLKECKLIKDEVEYPFIKYVKVNTRKMYDEEFYNNYKLNYETWAKAVGKSL